VKIAASARLTVEGIVEASLHRKGLDAVGIVDSHSPPVLEEIEGHLSSGLFEPLTGGGLTAGSLLVVLGSEVEVAEESVGPVHYVCYHPDLETARAFSRFLEARVTNVSLSSQKARTTGEKLARWVRRTGGFMVPAHVFTPHKGFFGQGATDLRQAFSDRALEAVPAVELGLSADAGMADLVQSLEPFTYLTNSDAHSPETIAREHNAVLPPDPPGRLDFEGLASSIRAGRLAANYGLDPRLGKYHRARCPACGHTPEEGEVAPGEPCPACGKARVVGGVADRVRQMGRDAGARRPARRERTGRPPYIHHIPLRYVPGVGRATLEKLLDAFGTEMNVLHEVSRAELAAVVGERLARRISAARGGTRNLDIAPGAAGRYGRVRPT